MPTTFSSHVGHVPCLVACEEVVRVYAQRRIALMAHTFAIGYRAYELFIGFTVHG